MRTVIDHRGCNTTPGAVGLTVADGDLVVNGVDVLRKLQELSSTAAQPAVVVREAPPAVNVQTDVSIQLGKVADNFDKVISEVTAAFESKLSSIQKELKDSKKDNEKLADRVKTLEADLKKASKATGKTTPAVET